MSIRLVVGGLMLLTLLLLTACNNPEEPPDDENDWLSTVGNYTGIYQFVEIENGVDTIIDTAQLIEFIFRQNEYTMDMDVSIPESLRVFCDVVGTYKLGNGVELNITDSNFTRGVCPQYWGPGGYFSLDQTTDTIRMLNDGLDSLGVRRVRYLRIVNVD